MSDFVVRIDTAKLTDKQAAAVAGAIQGAVMSALGNLDLAHAPGTPTGSITFHPEWRGIWLRALKDLQDPKVQQQVLTVQAKGL
jgi:hypothetical protein